MTQYAFQADQLFIGNGDVIPQGIVELNEFGKISHVGVSSSSSSVIPEKVNGIICPGFINTHCHLELSHLRNTIEKKTGITGFIQELQSKRAQENLAILKAIEIANQEMVKNGIVAVGDICNDKLSFSTKEISSIAYHNFIELFGIQNEQAEAIFYKGQQLQLESKQSNLPSSIVPHSPYSVSKTLFTLIKNLKSNPIISIHNQESFAENELFKDGKGLLWEMLQKFGLKTNQLQKGNSALQALLPLLNDTIPTLLVHNTFTSKEDIRIAEEQHKLLYWCFCPNANEFIEGTIPPIPLFIDEKVKCTLGTDSLASNHGLSILDEMKTIQANYPEISFAQMLPWACENGADFLGLNDKLGTIEVGKTPGINLISGINSEGSLVHAACNVIVSS